MRSKGLGTVKIKIQVEVPHHGNVLLGPSAGVRFK